MKLEQIRTFLPSIDFEESKRFYIDLGFALRWENEEMAIFGEDTQSFFLQKYYVKDWAENLMMQLFVLDLDDTFEHFNNISKKYNVKIRPIFEAEYGRTFHLLGPAGELWHVTEAKDKDHQELICDE